MILETLVLCSFFQIDTGSVPSSHGQQGSLLLRNPGHVSVGAIPFNLPSSSCADQSERIGFSEGYARIALDNYSKWGFIDKSGAVVIAPQFESACEFSDGLAAIRVNGKWGYLNKQGRVAIQPQFDCVQSFTEGLACVHAEGRFAFIDHTGSVVIKVEEKTPVIRLKEMHAYPFSEGLAVIYEGKTPVFVDHSGRVVLRPQFPFAGSFQEGLAIVGDNARFGFIDRTGATVIPPSFAYEWTNWHAAPPGFSEGLAPFSVDRRFGFINVRGETVIPPQFQYAYSFKEGLARVYHYRGSSGFIDPKGNYVIDGSSYKGLGDFSEGLASVQQDNTCGFIDKTGRVVVKPTFDGVWPFHEGYALVTGEKFGMGYIDRNGQFLWKER